MYDRIQQHASTVGDRVHTHRRMTWRGVIASVLLVAAVPAVVAAISYPLVTTLTILAVIVAIADHALQTHSDSRTRPHRSTIPAATATAITSD